MAERRIVVEFAGDTRSLERAFAKSSKSAKSFNRDMSRGATGVTRQFSAMRAGIAGVAGGTVALGLRDVVQVASEAQQVIGQTSLAVENAGLSWKQYSAQIQKTIQAQSQFGFDDEALLRSFSLFVRGSGSVDEALKRNALAMDVARARYIDLDQASALVNKAAMGQAGALRRAGIQVDKNATSVELLATLQEKFGGSAERASDDAATAMERLNVQTENAKESLGTLALPVVTELAAVLGDAAAKAQILGDNLQRVGDIDFGGGDVGGVFGEAFKRAVRQQVPGIEALGMLRPLFGGAKKAGEEAGRTTGDSFRTALREHLNQVSPDDPTPRRRLRPEQRNQFFDARIARQLDRLQDLGLQKQAARLRLIAIEVRARLAITQDATRRLTLEDQLLGIQRQQAAVQASIAEKRQAATAVRIAGTDARVARQLDRLQDLGLRKQVEGLRRIAAEVRSRLAVTKDTTRRLTLEDQLLGIYRQQRSVQEQIGDSIRAANQALKDRADAIKSAVLDRLQAQQTAVLNKRALADARERLRVAQQLGTGAGVREAQRGLADVRMDMLRARVENAPATLTGAGRFQLAGVVININGVTDPAEVARRVEAILKKRNRRTTTSIRPTTATA